MTMVKKHPYATPAGASFLIHMTLLLLALFTGQMDPVSSPPEQPPIEVEIEPSKLLDMGSGKLRFSSGSPSPGPKTARLKASAPARPGPLKPGPPNVESEKQAVAIPPTSTELFPAAPTGEPEDTSVAVPLYGITDSTGAGDGAGGKGGAGRSRESGGAGGTSVGDGEGGGFTGTGFRSGDLPSYPRAARRAGREGMVVLRVLVDTDGNAAVVTVQGTSGHTDFDEAACSAVKKWRFSPARQGQKPISSFHDVKVRFRLR
jgi:protein TonB